MDREFVHAGFLASPTVRERFPISLDWDLEMRMPLNHGVLIAVPELDLETLSFDKVRNLVEQSCRYMTGLAVPETLTGVASDCLGLAGIRTFSNYAKALVPEQERNLARDMLLYLSRQLMWVASSRYWFHQLIQRFQEQLLPVADERGVLLRQFETVIQTWRTVGARLGSDAHTGDPDAATRVAVGLEKAYKREARLFLGLLAALPGVDRRDEILESLYQRYPPASLEEQELQPASKFVAPRTPAEETLAKVWAEVLEVERVGVYDNFFDLGGDSLLMARVHGKLQENFGKDVSILDLFKNPTIGALARYMTQTQQEGPVREHTQERGQKYRAALMRQRRRLRGSDR
jgi:acyl carrier protein